MILGLVIAGGQGQRLGGVCKADLIVGGTRLRERAVTALARRCQCVLVATGPDGGGEIDLPDHPDDPPGPVAALFALQRWMDRDGGDTHTVLTASVDAPGCPDSYADRLLEALESEGAAFAACGDFDHPTHAGWRREALAEALAERPNSPRAALNLAHARRVAFAPEDGADPFRSINRMTDLIYWQTRFAQGSPRHN